MLTDLFRLAAVAVAATGVVAAPASADPVTTLPVLKRALTIVAKEEGDDNQVLFMMVDAVKKGQTKSQTMTLDAGATYHVYAVGDDNRIKDIDLKVDDADGKEVGRDEDDTNLAIVELRVRKTQQFKFKVEPFRMRAGVGDGFFALIIVRVE
ncbi:MAG: hypothetical protein K2X82_24155 [Gemmataceae bacterium]|nr:hypothetical protein [Gemmataceae bacterium]